VVDEKIVGADYIINYRESEIDVDLLKYGMNT
jgi:hypothetical protein